MAEPRAYEDAWVQALAILALISGIYTVRSYAAGVYTSPPAVPAPAPPAAPLPAPVRPAVRAERDLAALVAQAAAGATVVLPPGRYAGPIELTKYVVLRGGGSSPDDVVISAAGPRTITVSGVSAMLINLTVENEGGAGGAAVYASGGTVATRQVTIRSSGTGVWAVGSNLQLVSAEISGRVGVLIEAGARGSIQLTSVTGREAAVTATGSDVNVAIERGRLESPEGTGLAVSRFARVRLSRSTVSGSRSSGVLALTGAEVSVSGSELRDNQGCGVRLGDAQVKLDNVLLQRNQCGVGFVGAGMLTVDNSRFLELSMGAIAVKPGLAGKITVKGKDNYGLSIPEPTQ
ncbi:MAG: right-handed parallel beta-helix repeat-containing protein [Elusimicrobia bacterium]|nr:right-handed parallel beta-helix repeat-containing protein [Elusimicrobiota bacterium]